MENTEFTKRRIGAAAIFLAFALLLTSCGKAKPFDYTETGEIPAGPGLFSGKDGKFSVFRK
ncbi:MAG: hypothetical protein VCF08_06055 [Alphaproteobacteria bacterium]|nr:hypothetical protein [Alphaproteobacteria bacterium]